MRNEILEEIPPHRHQPKLHNHQRYTRDDQDESVDWFVPKQSCTKEDKGDRDREETEQLLRKPNSRLPPSRKLLNPFFQIIVFLTPYSSHVECGTMIVDLPLIGKSQDITPLIAIVPPNRLEKDTKDDHRNQEDCRPDDPTLRNLGKGMNPTTKLSHHSLHLIENQSGRLNSEVHENGRRQRDDNPCERITLAIPPAEAERVPSRFV